MFRKKILIGLLVGASLLMQVPMVLAEPLPLHVECTNDSQCRSGDCEEGTKSKKSFCVCKKNEDCYVFSKQEGETWECINDDDDDLTPLLTYSIFPIKNKKHIGIDVSEKVSKDNGDETQYIKFKFSEDEVDALKLRTPTFRPTLSEEDY